MYVRRLNIKTVIAALAVVVGALALATGASAKTYRPTRTDDPKPNGCKPSNCSLREAVIAANNTSAPSCRVSGPAHRKCPVIALRPGKRYRLTRRSGRGDSPATGDLDLQSATPSSLSYTVETARGRSPATIDANGIDRVFDSIGSSGLTLNDVVLRGGHARGPATNSNIGGGSGGAIYGGRIKIHKSRLIKNVADGDGGAIYSRGGDFEVKRSRLKGNTAKGDGGALFMDGQADRILADVIKTRATHNRAGGAGGMAAFTNEGGIELSRSYVADNRAGGPGGGIESVRGNSAATDVTVDRSTITGNLSGSAGGGLATPWTVVTNSTISANRAATWGGGVVADFGEPGRPGLQMENSTSRTTVPVSAVEGSSRSTDSSPVAFNGPAAARLVAVTVARNTASQGGGLYQGAGDTLALQNTIVALNRAGAPTSGPDCFAASGGFASQGHNLIGDPSGCAGFPAVGDLIGGPLKLGKLADNGGPTKTVAVQPGSRAINAGDPTALPPFVVRVDQRGVKRTSPPDIGAYERHKKNKKRKK
jgi:CSLREA domain-containing protein